ncbi:hypothetical protein [Candidatus Carsonella ruddii]|uniref:Uncharacterized protein n=1 Tax=Candidatus Carsonella ruddii (Diaphorina cf. continua) TaxID=2661587 RepID=A0A7R6W0D3_CARRU|nr:hypothetical protein [Candidatus Carsonella ruddii (Diaphorina cf. continua)]BCG49285.1 hypothetical protein CRDco_0645 [Candidatus Carsonella ruddii (Diaphorina cf. continua)]
MSFSKRFKKENFESLLKRFKKNIEKKNKIIKKEKKKLLKILK